MAIPRRQADSDGRRSGRIARALGNRIVDGIELLPEAAASARAVCRRLVRTG
jgi:hypothetical protein